jgi:hypothetical protein
MPSERHTFDGTTPFQILLERACEFDLIDSTFMKIGDIHDHWVDVARYSPVERVIMLVWHSGGLIHNGGFEYLFAGCFDGDPDFRITAESYKEAGLIRGYSAFHDAFQLFPHGRVPTDPHERLRQYETANRSLRDAINRKHWQDSSDGLTEQKLAQFIREHAAELGELDKKQRAALRRLRLERWKQRVIGWLKFERQVRVCVDPLAQILADSERVKGAPLTRAEVEEIRDGAEYTLLPAKVAKGYYSSPLPHPFGGPRIDPENIWEEWQRVRHEMMLEE